MAVQAARAGAFGSGAQLTRPILELNIWEARLELAANELEC